MAFEWIGATSGLGSQVKKAKALPASLGRQMPAKAPRRASDSLNQTSSLPAFGFGSAKLEKGTRQRWAGEASRLPQNAEDKLRTLVTCFVTIVPGLLPAKVMGTPHAIVSGCALPSIVRTINAWRLGQMSASYSGSGRSSDQLIYSRQLESSAWISGSLR